MHIVASLRKRVPEVAPEEAYRLAQGSATLLDVRDPEELEKINTHQLHLVRLYRWARDGLADVPAAKQFSDCPSDLPGHLIAESQRS